MSERPFSRRALRWLIGICVVSFVVGIVLAVLGPTFEPSTSWSNDSYSTMPLGHRGFKAVLDKVGIPVLSSRHVRGHRADDDAVLVLAEPGSTFMTPASLEALDELLEGARRVLLVLPKWQLRVTKGDDGWEVWIDSVSATRSRSLLEAVDVPGDAQRFATTTETEWHHDGFEHVPAVPTKVTQLVTSPDLTPLVWSDAGTILGEHKSGDRHLLVLADPDILCNAGIHRGSNAELVVDAIERLRDGRGVVVIDETLHGHRMPPSIWREIFSFPIALIMIHVGLVLAVLLWAGMGRFGAPAPPPPALEPGQRFLIRSTADLLQHGDRTKAVLKRYLENAVQEARQTLRAPEGATGAELATWLDHVAEVRGTPDRVADLRRAIDLEGGERTGAALRAARRIHDWKQEIVHGHPGRT